MTQFVVERVSAGTAHAHVVQDVSFAVASGSAIAILGRNGSGKSTLMEALSGIIPVTSGRIVLDGADITRHSPDRRARSGIALVPEGRRIFPRLSVAENLRLGAFNLAPSEHDAALQSVVGLFPVLGDRLESPAGAMSGGQQQMLAIGRALMASPPVLLLDEPSLGLAPKPVADVYATLERLRDEGMAIVLVEQQVSRALDLCDHAVVLQDGRIALEAPTSTLENDDRLWVTYLGR